MLRPPSPRRPVPGVDKLLEVEAIIQKATFAGESPLSINEVKRRMGVANPRHSQVRDCIDILRYHGRITETERGVEYAYLPPSEWARMDTVRL